MTSKIAHYEILGELGRGGMGVVYDAMDPRLDRHVAIKVIELPNDPNMTQATRDELLERFKREAKASAKLNHPNIVSIYDFGEYEGRSYMVMEFLQGRNLSELLKIQSPMAVPLALKALIQTAEALDFAHHQGIIHRDIKSANIVILDNGTTKLADFGIARLEASNSELTQAGSILGSLLYISPEQLMNPKDVDKRADIYSLGVTAYEILTGRLPYTGENIGEIVMKVMQSEPPLMSELNPEVPSTLDAVIFKAMAKTADLRYDSAADFAQALKDLQSGIGVSSGTGELQHFDLDSTIVGGAMPSDQERTQFGAGTASGSSTLSTGTISIGGTSAGTRSKEYSLLSGMDDPTPFSAIMRVMRDWNVENMTTNTMLEAIYKYEGKSQGLLINNSVILLIYKGLIVGAVSKNSDLIGGDAYKLMAAWSKFEMTQCIPLEKDEPWLVLLAIICGASTLMEDHPMISEGEIGKIVDQQKSRNFSGMLWVQQRQQARWIGLLDGVQVFSVTMPYSEGTRDSEFAHIKVYAPRMNLVGPSLRKLLTEADLQVVRKSANQPQLSEFVGPKMKSLTLELMEKSLRNMELTPVMGNNPVFEIGNRKIKYSDIVRETNHFKVIDWLLYEYMYALSRSEAFHKLKTRFTWLWQIKSMKFLQPVKMGSFSATFDVLGYNSNDQIIGLFRIESQVSDESLQNLIADIKHIKKERPQDNIQAGVLVSLNPMETSTLLQFDAQTQKPGNLPFLNFGENQRGFVKTGWNQGFFVFLAETSETGLELKAPELPVEYA